MKVEVDVLTSLMKIIRLCIAVTFYILRSEPDPHTCIVIERFGALEMHLLLLFMVSGDVKQH